MMRSNHRKRV